MKHFIASILLLTAGGLNAYSGQTDRAVVQKVALWGPKDARILFTDYPKQFWRGFDAGRRMPAPTEREALRLTDDLVERFHRHQPMEEIMERWGYLTARLLVLTDPSRPPGSAAKFSRRIIDDFPHLVRKKQARVPVIFTGFDRSFFEGNRRAVLDRMKKDHDRWTHLLKLDYARLKPGQTYRVFDDRSNAFGVVSLSLNRSFTVLEHFWYYIWRRAGGRMGPLTLDLGPDSMLVVSYGY